MLPSDDWWIYLLNEEGHLFVPQELWFMFALTKFHTVFPWVVFFKASAATDTDGGGSWTLVSVYDNQEIRPRQNDLHIQQPNIFRLFVCLFIVWHFSWFSNSNVLRVHSSHTRDFNRICSIPVTALIACSLLHMGLVYVDNNLFRKYDIGAMRWIRNNLSPSFPSLSSSTWIN